jgi:hypothetical protein
MNRYIAVSRLSCVFVALAVLACCSRQTPAGFWATYRPELIARKYSDQGPWGGVRWVHWVAPAPGTFTLADVESFATSHGWVCQKPVAYSAQQIHVWQYSGKPVFPLHFGSANRPPDNATVMEFPRDIDGDSLVVQCDSRWVRVEPGSGKSSTALGYIQIDKSGTRLAVYHLWGET